MAAPCAEPQRGVWRQGHSHLAILPKPGLPGPHRRSSLSPQPFSEQDGEATKPTTKTAQGLSPSCRPERGPWPGDTAEGQLGVSGSVSAPSSPPLQDEGVWPTGLSLPQNTSARGGRAPSDLTARGQHPWAGAAGCEKPGSPRSPRNSRPAGPRLGPRSTSPPICGAGLGGPAAVPRRTPGSQGLPSGSLPGIRRGHTARGPVPGLCRAPSPRCPAVTHCGPRPWTQWGPARRPRTP